MTSGNYKPWVHSETVTIAGVTRFIEGKDKFKTMMYNHDFQNETKSLNKVDDVAKQSSSGFNWHVYGCRIWHVCSAQACTVTFGHSNTVDVAGTTIAVIQLPFNGNQNNHIPLEVYIGATDLNKSYLSSVTAGTNSNVHRVELIVTELPT